MAAEHDRLNEIISDPLSVEVRELLNPSRSALFVIDIQKGYCDSNGSTPKLINSDTQHLQAMIPQLEKFIAQARAKGLPIVWTRMIEDPDLSAENVRRKMRLTDIPALITPGTPDFEYFQIAPKIGDLEITKRNYDAFTEPEVEDFLKENGVQALILTGAYTDVCVASTMRGAQSRGYDIFIPKDLVGTPDNLKELGEATLKTADVVFGWVTSSEEINKVWNKYPDNKGK